MTMKIEDVRTRLLDIPLGEPGLYDGGPPPPAKSWQYILVEIRTDDSTVGYGGQMPKNDIDAANKIRYIDEVMKPYLVEELVEPFYIGKYVNTDVTKAPTQIRAPSCVEMALWDLVGKSAGKPVYKLLGATKDRVKAYATVPHEYPDWTADQWVEMTKRVWDDGFRAVKLEMSTGKGIVDVKRDINTVKAVREEFGDKLDIMVDAENGWSTSPHTFNTALKLARGYEEYDVIWMEEPLNHVSRPDLCAKLAAAVDLQIAGGGQITYSYNFRTILEKKALDIVQPDVENVGGITETRRVAQLAEDFGQVCVCHSFGPGLLIPATLQVVGSTNIPYVENVYYPPVITYEIRDSLLTEELRVEDGYIDVPSKPGLGVELDIDMVEKYTVKKK